MPKGRKKGRNYEKKRYEANNCSDDESLNDSASVVSTVSDIRSICEDIGSGVDAEETENNEHELLIEKLKEAIDGATQKSSKGRQSCLECLDKAFAAKYLPEFVVSRRETITDCVKSSLKRGKSDEQGAAAVLAVLTCVQLGPGDNSDEMFNELYPLFITAINDNAIPVKARSKCATALALLAFIIGEIEKDTISSIMASFETQFSASYLKGNGAVPTHTLETTTLHAHTLAAWSLLLTVIAPREVYNVAERHLNRLSELLESSDVELRIAAGETIALLYEITREHDENFVGEAMDSLCVKLKQLATDSHKYRAKKERKQQRSSFRDILKTVEDREVPFIQVRFGQEVLELDSWCRKRQYDALCNVLGSGMNRHLAENDLLRDIFELGTPLTPNGAAAMKISKFERHMGNVAACKKRTLARSKVRDKRSVIMG